MIKNKTTFLTPPENRHEVENTRHIHASLMYAKRKKSTSQAQKARKNFHLFTSQKTLRNSEFRLLLWFAVKHQLRC